MEIRLSLGKFKMEQLISILPFPDFTKRTRIFCTICLDYLCQASCWEKWTNLLVLFLLLIQLNPIPVFGAKKITVHVPYDRKIFIESSIKMVSAQCLLLFLLHTYMCVYTLIIWLPFQPTTEPKVDNIRMAGYMEKLPVKSNQKKVYAVMKNPAMSIVHWSHSPIPCLILRLCKGRLHQERCLHLDDRNFILTT